MLTAPLAEHMLTHMMEYITSHPEAVITPLQRMHIVKFADSAEFLFGSRDEYLMEFMETFANHVMGVEGKSLRALDVSPLAPIISLAKEMREVLKYEFMDRMSST